MRALILAAALLLPFTAFAQDRAVVAKTVVAECPMQEQVNLSINFNFQINSPAEAKSKFDAKLVAIEALAKQAKLKKWTLQSMSYSVSSNGGYNEGDSFSFSGSASYQTDNADQAIALMEQLSKQKFNSSVSVNKYVNGNCGNVNE
jgi:hypothetical protein